MSLPRRFTGSIRNIAFQTTSKPFPTSSFPDKSPSVLVIVDKWISRLGKCRVFVESEDAE